MCKITPRDTSETITHGKNTVDEWNLKHPVGTLVQVSNSLGVVTKAPTSAPAMLLMKSTPIIWLKGIHNYIALSRVEVI
ncbi:hypothetical protein B0F88_10377 [Methylobacter tundripaludum]|uniref:Uncharacterized protein n=1 Tax=Methylobacter tundripaludum TaxID=173365 RepID=A0A2S6H5A7_9GAMM|nr:hypothetical protein [Methylobacter tundripaludum]PPK72644.1 hypothetical protein B0F88_10377 [Methylobacter tundripaludum]